MTEEIAATPGWVEERLDTLFEPIPRSPEVAGARSAYAACLAARKAPAAPSDLLGAEFAACRPALRSALMSAGIEADLLTPLDAALEALEAEVASGS